MARRRILFVYGTRPEAVKMAPLIRLLAQRGRVGVQVAVSGQHREMLRQVHEVFGLSPDVDLELMRPGQSLADITAGVLTGLGPVLDEGPDAVVVQGDTTTTMAAALAAYYRRIPVVHLEAGLRSGNLDHPYPEEMNRRLTTRLATLHLAPTASNAANLLAEGVDPATVTVTGNTVIDALLATLATRPDYADPRLTAVAEGGHRIVTVTTHRRESWGDPMRHTAQALSRLAAAFPDVSFVLPMHRNPVVREILQPVLESYVNVLLVEPLPYPQFCRLMADSTVVLSDSGGVQEEAPSLGVPVLVLREATERPEAVAAGCVRLVGTDTERIVAEVTELLTDEVAHAGMARVVNPYGDGQAAARCAAAIEALLGVGERLPDFDPGAIGVDGVAPHEPAGDAVARDGNREGNSAPRTDLAAVRLADIRSEPLSLDEVVQSVQDPAAGGVAVFAGVVRDHDADRGVTRLDYSAHPGAAAVLQAVCERIAARPGLTAVAAAHRTGSLAVGDTAVLVAVSAPHRDAALSAARLLIDAIKAEVPIWKEQDFVDGTRQWVGTP